MPYQTQSDPTTRSTSSTQPACHSAKVAVLASRSKLRVLVADDNSVNALLARHLLESFGCHVEIASSGELALSMHAENAFHLIIMDCQMDQLDGFAATRRLRAAEPENERTPVVGWTSDANGQRALCINSGMDDVLQKPISKEALARVLDRWGDTEVAPADSCAPPTAPLVEKELRALQDLFGNEFESVANIYTAETPRRLAALDASLAAGDPVAAGRLAHALAGSSASIGARNVSELCRALELACREGTSTECPSLVEKVRRAYSEFSERLAAAVASSQS
jgi:CheY-like chemotaxis protein